MLIIRLDTADIKVHVLSAETIKPFNYFTRVHTRRLCHEFFATHCLIY